MCWQAAARRELPERATRARATPPPPSTYLFIALACAPSMMLARSPAQAARCRELLIALESREQRADGGIEAAATASAALLWRVALKLQPNVVDASGASPFHAAAASGDVDAVRLLLRCGWSMRGTSLDGMTAFHLAAVDTERGSSVLHCLLDHDRAAARHRRAQKALGGLGAAASAQRPGSRWRMSTGNSWSPLWGSISSTRWAGFGSWGRRSWNAARILRLGAPADGATALHMAALVGNVGVAAELVRFDHRLVGCLAWERAAAGALQSPLEESGLIAAAASRPEARLLLRHGRSTPLHWVGMSGCRATAAVLIASAALEHLQALDSAGCTAFMLACACDSGGVVAEFLKDGRIDPLQAFSRPDPRGRGAPSRGRMVQVQDAASRAASALSQPLARRWTGLHAAAYLGCTSVATVVSQVASGRVPTVSLSTRLRVRRALATLDSTGQSPAMLAAGRGFRATSTLLHRGLSSGLPAETRDAGAPAQVPSELNPLVGAARARPAQPAAAGATASSGAGGARGTARLPRRPG